MLEPEPAPEPEAPPEPEPTPEDLATEEILAQDDAEEVIVREAGVGKIGNVKVAILRSRAAGKQVRHERQYREVQDADGKVVGREEWHDEQSPQRRVVEPYDGRVPEGAEVRIIGRRTR